MSRSTQSPMPKIFFVAYPLPNGEMHLAFRSEAINGVEVIAEVDSAEKYSNMTAAAAVQSSQIPDGALEQHLLPFLGFKFSSKIDSTIQRKYFCALDRFINPRVNCRSAEFFQANPESPLSELELEILGDLVLNGEKAMLKFCLSQLSDKQLEQVFNSETKIKATDYSARKYEFTLLQLGIAAGDVSFNEKNVGIVEMMLEYLKRHNPENYQAILTEQALELFDESLRVYARKQKKEIVRLRKLGGELQATDAEQVEINKNIQKEAQARKDNYTAAISSNNLDTILKVHSQAQKENCFNGFDAVIAKIENASYADIQAVLNNPTIDSPLSNALKQFREAFTQHSHSEKIVNREHLLKILELYDEFYLRLINEEPNEKKRELFWCHLVGEVERGFAACDAQIFANPGLYEAVGKGARNRRSFNFKSDGGSIFPLSLDSNSGLGYKFAALLGGWMTVAMADCEFCGPGPAGIFRNLCRAKTSTLENLCCTRQQLSRGPCA